MRPGPEFADRRRPGRWLALAEEAPRLQERGQGIDRQRRGSGLLGELLAARQDRDRMVQVRRRRKTEPALQPDLARCRGKQIGAAHDVGNALRCVVHDDCELIREQTIGAPDDDTFPDRRARRRGRVARLRVPCECRCRRTLLPARRGAGGPRRKARHACSGGRPRRPTRSRRPRAWRGWPMLLDRGCAARPRPRFAPARRRRRRAHRNSLRAQQ